MTGADVFGIEVATTDVAGAAVHVAGLVETARPAYVCFANVHLVELAQREPEIRRSLAEADLVLPDGAPIAWVARVRARVTGSDMFEAVNELAARDGRRVFLLGSTEDTLSDLEAVLAERLPGIDIVGTYAPPYAPAAELDVVLIAERIRSANADIIWVGLGAPKQELVMNALRPRLDHGVMLGVGAVFDFASGRKRRAPALVQRVGLEWLHRLFSEPRRLWRRYAVGNARFAFLIVGRAVRTRQLRG